MEIKDTELRALVEKQQRHFDTWREGEPVEVFMADGLPCVRFESQNWWHYDLARGRWF